MRGLTTGALALAALCLLSAPAGADESVLVLDPSATEVRFRLGATLHSVRGSFRLESAELRVDLERESISGSVVLDARSGETGIGARDRIMHEEVLESERYPRVVFRPRSLRLLRRAGAQIEAEVSGVVEIRGLARELTLPVRAALDGEGGVRIESEFSVPYVAWGLRDVSRFVFRVNRRVALTVYARGTVRPARPGR